MEQNKIEINSYELTIFQNMLINLGKALNKIENNYNLISKSKLIYIFHYKYYLRISTKYFSSFRKNKK